MSSYNSKVHMDQGGAQLSVESGGTINMETGGKVLANGTQAGAIADTTGSYTMTQMSTTVNSILVALRGAGVIASA